MRDRSWFIDEQEYAGGEHLDSEYVKRYDRKAGLDAADELANLANRGLGPGSVLVDLGAGTGELALAAAKICGQVVAVDVSPVMVEAMRAKARARGVMNLEIVQAGLLTYESQRHPVDFVYTRHALHHLPDFWKTIALGRMSRILKRGGTLRLIDLVFSFEPNEADHVIAAWLAGAPKNPELGWTRGELELHLRQEYSTFTWLLEPMLMRAGFEIVDAAYARSKVHASYTCVKR